MLRVSGLPGAGAIARLSVLRQEEPFLTAPMVLPGLELFFSQPLHVFSAASDRRCWPSPPCPHPLTSPPKNLACSLLHHYNGSHHCDYWLVEGPWASKFVSLGSGCLHKMASTTPSVSSVWQFFLPKDLFNYLRLHGALWEGARWVTIAHHLLFPLSLALKVFRGKGCAFSSHPESELPPSLGTRALEWASPMGLADCTWEVNLGCTWTVNVHNAGFRTDVVSCCAIEWCNWFDGPLVPDDLLAFFDYFPISIQCYFRVSSLCYLTGDGCVGTIPVDHRFWDLLWKEKKNPTHMSQLSDYDMINRHTLL